MTFQPAEIERYARHLVLHEIGGPGQQKLKGARAVLIGAGGLGAPCALYLAAAGVGVVGLVDDDTVALSNLQRQILYETADVGRVKVDAARARLTALNPEIEVVAHAVRLDATNAAQIISGYDLVIDGSDTFETRFIVNAAALAAGVPLLTGALGRWTGQVAVLNGAPCYRCLVPETPPHADTCQTVGVVGALAGVVGALMALEAVKWIVGAGEPLLGRLLVYDALASVSRTVRLTADPACPACGRGAGLR